MLAGTSRRAGVRPVRKPSKPVPFLPRRGLSLEARTGKPTNALLHCHGGHHGVEHLNPVRAAKFAFAGAFGMRHHAQHVAAFAADAGNVLQGTVRIALASDLAFRRAVAENNALVTLQRLQSGLVAEIIAVHMPNGNGEHLARSEEHTS